MAQPEQEAKVDARLDKKVQLCSTNPLKQLHQHQTIAHEGREHHLSKIETLVDLFLQLDHLAFLAAVVENADAVAASTPAAVREWLARIGRSSLLDLETLLPAFASASCSSATSMKPSPEVSYSANIKAI